MKPWILHGTAQIPGDGGELKLLERDGEFTLKLGTCMLMNSRLHSSEDDLATLAIERYGAPRNPVVLIGGLGMGYTLASALKRLGPGGRALVSEIVPAVVEWNRGPLGHLAGFPLKDDRVTVLQEDVCRSIAGKREAFNAIMLDVDNTPEGLVREANNWLYAPDGLKAAMAALRPKGVMSIWSARPDKRFVKRMKQAGFDVREVPARARDKHTGGHHTIWLASRR